MTMTLSKAAKAELAFDGPIKRGSRGMDARRVQEWLTFQKFGTTIDEDFGSATEAAVRRFQEARGLPPTGSVDEATWKKLTEPMLAAMSPVTVAATDSLPAVVLRVAQQHLRVHPLEVGGDNKGPWVRLYMEGNQGSQWFWCAGFVTFVLRQACDLLDRPMPIPGSFSCDSLAYQAQEAGRWVSGTSLDKDPTSWSRLGECQIFLVRRTPTDWTHTGFSFKGQDDSFSTIEGNTNDEGSRNGYEVCQRVRGGLASKDFIRLQ